MQKLRMEQKRKSTNDNRCECEIGGRAVLCRVQNERTYVRARTIALAIVWAK